jgi:ATP/maltotriose-dependent transcriptional regulator MalT
MASVEEVRAAVALAKDKAEEAAKHAQQVTELAEEVQTLLSGVMQGTTQGDAEEANGQFAQAVSSANDTLQVIGAGISTIESIGNRL